MTPSVAHLPLRGVMAGFRRFSISEYHHLARLGILTEDDDLELLEGYLVHKMTRNPPHDCAMHLLLRLLSRMVPDEWEVRCQAAVTLGDSEPEPDLAIVRTDAAHYKYRHPAPADIAIAIEVADSTLASDRADKCRIYARAGIQVYWIVNIVDQQVEVYSSPIGDPTPGYRDRADRHPGDEIEFMLDGRRVGSVAVSAVLG
jgi:Uma2 family endonuclease